MTRKIDPTQQPEASNTDAGRRRALKTLGKAAYVAPVISILPMEKLLAAASSTGCRNSWNRGRGC